MDTKHQTVNQLSRGDFIFEVNRYLIEYTLNTMSFIRTLMSSLNKHSIKNIVCSIDDELIRLPPHLKYFQLHQEELNSIKCKDFKEEPLKKN